MSCQAVNYKSKSIGKYFKFTKKEYSWDFVLENQSFNLKLLHSKISGRFEIKVNGKTNFKCQQREKFYHGFEILNHSIKIKSVKDSFKLFIDNNSFGDILEGTTVIDSNEKFKNNRHSTYSNNTQTNKNMQHLYNKRNTDINIPQFSNQNAQNFNQPNKNSNFFIPVNNNTLFNPNNIPTNPQNNTNFNNNFSNYNNTPINFNKIPDLQNNSKPPPKLITQSSEKFFENLDFLPIND